MKKTEPSDSVRSKLLLTGLCLFFLVLGSASAMDLVQEIGYRRETREWAETDCVISTSQAVNDQPAEEYRIAIEYTYVFDGQSYQSTQIRRDTPEVDWIFDAYEWMDRFPAGSSRRCYVDPSDPTQAVLNHDPVNQGWWLPLPLLFVGIGAVLLWFQWRPARPTDRKARDLPREEDTGRTSAADVLVPWGVLSVFVLVGLLCGWFAFACDWVVLRDSQTWDEHPCVIESGRLLEESDEDKPKYRVDICYVYTVDGIEYRSSDYEIGDAFSGDRSGQLDILNRFLPGQKFLCYVNPENPRQAILSRSLARSPWLAIIPGVFLVAGVAGMISMVVAHLSNSEDECALTDQDGSVTLCSERRVAAFAGMGVFALVWNGLVSVFIYMEVQQWANGESGMGDLIVLIPFALVGLAVIVGVVYYGLACFNPRLTVRLSRDSLVAGESFVLSWEFEGANDKLRSLHILLEGIHEILEQGQEEATTEVIAEMNLLETTDSTCIERGEISVKIPYDARPSFEADEESVVWALLITGKIPRMPDVKTSHEISILP